MKEKRRVDHEYCLDLNFMDGLDDLIIELAEINKEIKKKKERFFGFEAQLFGEEIELKVRTWSMKGRRT